MRRTTELRCCVYNQLNRTHDLPNMVICKYSNYSIA